MRMSLFFPSSGYTRLSVEEDKQYLNRLAFLEAW